MEVSRGSGVCAALCIRRTLFRHVTICTLMVIFLLFDCLLTVFDDSYTIPIVKNTQNHCTNNVPIVKYSQKQSKDSQNSKNDHWCTNRHMSTKTVPTVYQQCTNRQKQSKKSQKTVKTAKMTICVPTVTCLPRLYQQCTNRQK